MWDTSEGLSGLHHNSAPSRDVSDWDLLERDTTSTKKGIWLSEPSGSCSHRRWLFKPCYLEVQRDVHGVVMLERRHGDDWSELVSSSVGRQLGVAVAEYELAERHGEPGILTPSFVRHGEGLEHGNELLAGLDPNYSKHKKRVVSGYTVERVIGALAPFRPPRGCGGWVTNAADAFVGYLVLDALIANCDRHHSNWAVISGPGGERRLAPAYDQASSLGHQAPDKERRLAEGRVRGWVEKGRSKHFEGLPQLVDLARTAAGLTPPEVADAWRERVRSFDPEALTATLERIPTERMSQVDRIFALEVLRLNRERLLDGWQ